MEPEDAEDQQQQHQVEQNEGQQHQVQVVEADGVPAEGEVRTKDSAPRANDYDALHTEELLLCVFRLSTLCWRQFRRESS